MRTLLLFFAFLLVLNLPLTLAQHDDSKDYWAIRALAPNFKYQISKNWNWSDFKSGLEFEYGHNLGGGPFSLTFPFRIGQADFPLNKTASSIKQGGFLGLDALIQARIFKPSAMISPNVFAGLGAAYESPLNDFGLALPLGIGLDFRLGDGFYLSTKGEYRLGFSDLRNNLQLGAGFKIFLGEGAGKDTDKDGIADREDLCPTLPGTVKTSGCPDADGDGIADDQDQCPTDPGPAATKGCPDMDNDGVIDRKDPCPTEAGTLANNGCPDSDNDGIINSLDKCPTEAGPASNSGCPVRDADGDGILDVNDDCPNAAGPANTKGCPDRDGDGVADKNDLCPDVKGAAVNKGCPDTDGDGLIDSIDKCPNQPGPAANNGCPEITQKDKETLNFAARNVQFETGSSKIKNTSFGILDQVAEILKRYSDYNVRIAGHTDNVGSYEFNLTLSRGRAKSCYDYLVSKGVSASRITFEGFGSSRPIGNNATSDGRAQNRRTEFELFQR